MSLRSFASVTPRVRWGFNASAAVFAVSISADGTRVLAGSSDHHAYLLDASGQVQWAYSMEGKVFGASLLVDGRALLLSRTGEQKLVELTPSGRQIGTEWRFGPEVDPFGIAATADGGRVVVGANPGGVMLFDWPARRLMWTALEEDRFWHVGVTSPPLRVVAASRSGYVVLLDGSGHELWRGRANRDFVGAAISLDARTIIAGDWTDTIRCFGEDGAAIWTYASRGKSPKGIAVSRDAEFVAVATESGADIQSGPGQVLLIDRRGELLWAHGVLGNAQDVDLTPDGRFVAFGTQGGEVCYLENPCSPLHVSAGPFAGATVRAMVLPRVSGGAP